MLNFGKNRECFIDLWVGMGILRCQLSISEEIDLVNAMEGTKMNKL